MLCRKAGVPKASSTGQLLGATVNLQRMPQEIPLTDDERTAVDGGDLVALEKLTARLRDVPPLCAAGSKGTPTSEEA